MDPRNITSSRETVYFVLSFIVSLVIVVLAAISVIGLVILLILLIVTVIVNVMMLGSIRGNGVRINERQFPEVYERVVAMSKQMGIKNVPDVFVIQSEGALNAFATKFWGRNMVVLYSELFDLSREHGTEELDFIIAHELAHVKRRHVWKYGLIAPAQFIPFLSQAYSRSCEYTCDREAAYTINNVEASKRALAILSIGKRVYHEVNLDSYVEQVHTESHGAVWLSEVLSTHPNLPKRIQSINVFMNETGKVYREQPGKVIVGVLTLSAFVVGLYLAIVGAMLVGSYVYSFLLANVIVEKFNDFEQDADFAFDYEELEEEADNFEEEDSYYDEYEMTDLMIAIYEEDLNATNQLVNQDVDLEEEDLYGDTAVTYAVESFNPDILELVLVAGADPNVLDSYQSTPLISAVYSGFYDGAIILLDYGADPAYRDIDGDTAYSLMDVSTEEDLYEALLFE